MMEKDKFEQYTEKQNKLFEEMKPFVEIKVSVKDRITDYLFEVLNSFKDEIKDTANPDTLKYGMLYDAIESTIDLIYTIEYGKSLYVSSKGE